MNYKTTQHLRDADVPVIVTMEDFVPELRRLMKAYDQGKLDQEALYDAVETLCVDVGLSE